MPLLDRCDTDPARTELTKLAQLHVPISLPPAVVDGNDHTRRSKESEAEPGTPP
jgi:hypothetical protein